MPLQARTEVGAGEPAGTERCPERPVRLREDPVRGGQEAVGGHPATEVTSVAASAAPATACNGSAKKATQIGAISAPPPIP